MTQPSRPTLVVQWPRFGPYHHARLRAIRARFEREGWNLVAMETASDDAKYAWNVGDTHGFNHECLFPGAVFHALAPRAIHQAVTEVLDRLDPTAVAINAYSDPDARAALEWCRRRRRTAVVMSDSRHDDAPRSVLREALKTRIVREFDAALTAGTQQRAYLRELGLPDKVIFTPCDVVDNAFFAARAQAARAHPEAVAHLPGLTDPAPFFLATGRFTEVKNLAALIRAYGRYRRGTEAPWRLVLVGDGPLRTDLERLAAREAEGAVTFTGFRSPDDLAAYYGRAAALVHPAVKDTWGLVVNEAMAAGLPVLVSERAGCAEDLVRPGETGFRFDPHNDGAITHVLGQLSALTKAERIQLGAAAQQHITAYTPEAFADGLWESIRAGAPRTARPFGLAARGLLVALRVAARRTNSFQAIPD